MNRRKFLTLLGGGIITAAGAGATGFALTRTPNKALAPWADAGNLYKEPRKRALSYALLAPNPHNRQPWLVDLSVPEKITLYVDTNRVLPATDPYSRQITIGLGCFLELLRMAGAQDGYRVTLTPFPEGEDDKKLDARQVAEISFVQDASVAKDPLFAHVLQRRTVREPYDLTRKVEDKKLAIIENASLQGVTCSSTNNPERLKQIRKLTAEAFIVELETPATYKESVDLFRIGKSEIENNPDGLAFSGPFFESLALLGLFSREAAMDQSSASYQQALEGILESCNTAMGYVWLITQTNKRIDQLNSGRDWIRLHLAATAQGLSVQPMSQALQEFAEMKPHYQHCHQMLAPNGGTVQMLGRLGYAAQISPSPRWGLAHKIIKA